MKLFKHAEDSKLYGINNLTDDTLIGLFNVCLNYKAYLEGIMRLPDRTLITIAPGMDAKTVRATLELQKEVCEEYIDLWNETINKGGTKTLQN
jgi:hypothetical protein